MPLAQQAVNALLVFEVNVPQNTIAFDNFVQDIEIQRQFVDAFDLLHQFATDGAPDAVVMVELLEALGAEGMAAVNEYPGNSFSHVELISAIVAKVEASDLVVGLDLLDVVGFLPFLFQIFGLVCSLLLQGFVGAFSPFVSIKPVAPRFDSG